jgi:hypothetical protein
VELVDFAIENLLAEIPEMVLLRKDAGVTTGPNIKRPRSGRT